MSEEYSHKASEIGVKAYSWFDFLLMVRLFYIIWTQFSILRYANMLNQLDEIIHSFVPIELIEVGAFTYTFGIW